MTPSVEYKLLVNHHLDGTGKGRLNSVSVRSIRLIGRRPEKDGIGLHWAPRLPEVRKAFQCLGKRRLTRAAAPDSVKVIRSELRGRIARAEAQGAADDEEAVLIHADAQEAEERKWQRWAEAVA